MSINILKWEFSDRVEVVLMFTIRNMLAKDVEAVARMVALDHDRNREKGYREAKQHTLDHLEIVERHCYVVEKVGGEIVAAMVLHPQDKVFEIEDFHVKQMEQNKEALGLLKTRLIEYMKEVQTEVLCCPYAMKRLIAIE